jgi:carboxyl-terminal processing protease
MSHIRRSFTASGAVLLSIGALLWGNHYRTVVDERGVQPVGQIEAGSTNDHEDLLASNAPQIPEVNYFEAVSDLLKQEYVEPVTDDAKLVDGAIKGMITGLNDPRCVYMDPKEFRAFTDARVGRYEGIGAEMVLVTGPEAQGKSAATADEDDETAVDTGAVHIPRLVVALVVPGGPADRAGVKVGDRVDSLDGKWVLNAEPFNRLLELQKLVQAGKATLQEYNKQRQALREKTKARTLPTRARDLLTMGTEGTLTVTWMRGSSTFTTRIAKSSCRMPNLSDEPANGPLRIRFVPGEAERLKEAISHKSKVVLDLRGNVMGDFTSMKQCLAVLAPAGTYGYVERKQGTIESPVVIAQGNSRPPQVTILVDSTTGNAAENFALALSSKGRASLVGTAMSDDRSVSEVVALPDGGGYTLVKGEYSVSPAKKRTKPKRTAMDARSRPSRLEVAGRRIA